MCHVTEHDVLSVGRRSEPVNVLACYCVVVKYYDWIVVFVIVIPPYILQVIIQLLHVRSKHWSVFFIDEQIDYDSARFGTLISSDDRYYFVIRHRCTKFGAVWKNNCRKFADVRQMSLSPRRCNTNLERIYITRISICF